jgi:hypothetical protein
MDDIERDCSFVQEVFIFCWLAYFPAIDNTQDMLLLILVVGA